MNKVIHIEICKSRHPKRFNIRVGDIQGETSHLNCDRKDIDWEVDNAIKELNSNKTEPIIINEKQVGVFKPNSQEGDTSGEQPFKRNQHPDTSSTKLNATESK